MMNNNEFAEKLPLLSMKGISKRFGEVQALDKVDLDLNYNEILGLVGDNGAGKSTLMKVLTGVYTAEEGEIFLEGKKVEFTHPMQSRKKGIEMIYQDGALFPDLSVSANVFIGREPVWGIFRFLDEKKIKAGTKKTLSMIKATIGSEKQLVRFLSGGQQRAVAIGRSISSAKTRILINDEPTAGLGIRQVGKLLDLLVQLRKTGRIAIIFISHRFQDIFSIADRIVVLRGGRKVGDVRVEDTTPNEIANLVTGANIIDFHRRL